jgi:hypothetical protein
VNDLVTRADFRPTSGGVSGDEFLNALRAICAHPAPA